MSVAENPDWINTAPERRIDYLYERLTDLREQAAKNEDRLSAALKAIDALRSEVDRLKAK